MCLGGDSWLKITIFAGRVHLYESSLPNHLVRCIVRMSDKANYHKSNILFMGDLNIDLCTPQPTWDITTSLFGFHQSVRSATRIKSTTATVTDHMYTNNQTMVSEVLVSTASISDHSPIFCTWSFKLPEQLSKGHTSTEYRSFKNFDVEGFLSDLSTMTQAKLWHSFMMHFYLSSTNMHY